MGAYYYFLLITVEIKYTIKTHQDFKFMYVYALRCMNESLYVQVVGRHRG